MDDEIEAMCGCGWTVMFTPLKWPMIAGTATHADHGVVSVEHSNTRKLTERLFLAAYELDPTLPDPEEM